MQRNILLNWLDYGHGQQQQLQSDQQSAKAGGRVLFGAHTHICIRTLTKKYLT